MRSSTPWTPWEQAERDGKLVTTDEFTVHWRDLQLAEPLASPHAVVQVATHAFWAASKEKVSSDQANCNYALRCNTVGIKASELDISLSTVNTTVRVQELCESRGGRPGLSVLMSLTVSVDVKQHRTMLRHWSQFVPNTSTDIRGQ